MEKVKVVCESCGSVNSIPVKDSYSKANCGKCKNSLLETTPRVLNQESFDNLLANTELPVLVDFWAQWCGPCKMMAPVFKEASALFPLKAVFAKVDTESEQNLATKFGIRSIPTIIVFKNNVEVERVSGALPLEQLKALATKHI